MLPVLLTSGAPTQLSGVADRVYGEVDATDFLSARLDLTVSRLFSPPPLAGSPFHSTDLWVGVGLLSVDAQVAEHWSLHLDGTWSPPSTQQVAVALATQAARLQATSESEGVSAIAGYASAGTSSFEWSIDLLGGWMHYDSTQRIDALEGAKGPETAAKIRTDCKGSKTAACKSLLAALKSSSQVLDQGKVGGLATVTLFEATDVTLGVNAYFYAQDPSSLGDFRLATVGRLSGSSSGTAQLAPLVYSLRPEVTHRFGLVSLTASWLHGLYTDANGSTDSLSLKVSVRLASWRVWATVVGNRDIDGSGAVTPSVSFLVGARVRF